MSVEEGKTRLRFATMLPIEWRERLGPASDARPVSFSDEEQGARILRLRQCLKDAASHKRRSRQSTFSDSISR